MKAKQLIYIFIAGLLTIGAADLSLKDAVLMQRTFMIKVKDDNGNALSDTKITLFYRMGILNPDAPAKTVVFKSNTDNDGEAKIEGKMPVGIFAVISKEGYYDHNAGRIMFKQVSDGVFSDSCQIEIVLKKIINPVPMYVKNVHIPFPSNNGTFAFDCKVGDWVAPHGKGNYADFIFNLHISYLNQDRYDAKLTINCKEPADGFFRFKTDHLIGSELVSPQLAADSFGIKQILIEQSKNKLDFSSTGDRRDDNYIFRTRSRIDQGGNIITANYGKIHNGFSLYGVVINKPGINFTYYFNPNPNSKSLEFDTNKNLFPDIRINKP